MKLWQVQRHWDELAKADPFWAVLTESEKKGRRWTIEEFFSTGLAEADADVARARAREPRLGGRSALDFGCGAGRLTQGLAGHFGRVTGVDISGRMVALAREHNRNTRVSFVHNTRSHLRVFPDASFDFVYSRITLQHIAPLYAKRYLREFVRVLAPGGVMLVQVPATVPPGNSPERFRLSLWPPTVWMRAKRYVRYHLAGWFPGTPKMEMHAVARDEVLGCLADAGAEVLSVERDDQGGFETLTYIARKPGGAEGKKTGAGTPAVSLEQAKTDIGSLRLLASLHLAMACLCAAGIGLLVWHYLRMHSALVSISPTRGQSGLGSPIGQFLGTFKLFYLAPGAMLAVVGAGNLVSALLIGRRRCRMLSLLVACLNCVVVPVGTLLASFTVAVLLRDSVRGAYAARGTGTAARSL